jgi:creatinine amidohydrolase/Fe(II)-dependent formamide hydrolase-like protein
MTNLSTKELRGLIDAAHEQNKRSIAYLPVGCVEQHGPFLPLETDSLIAEHVSLGLLHTLADRYHGYVFPVIHYTPSQSNTNFCGTASVTDHCFRTYAREVCSVIMNSPFDALVTVAGHAGAESSLKEIGFWIVNEQFRKGAEDIRPVFVASIFEASSACEIKFQQKAGRHADWREFLLLYHILGEKYFTEYKIEAIKTFRSQNSFAINASSIYGVPMEYRSTGGILGDPLPSLGSDWEKMSSELWTFLIDNLADRIFNELEGFWKNKFPQK